MPEIVYVWGLCCTSKNQVPAMTMLLLLISIKFYSIITATTATTNDHPALMELDHC
jgi:hypothetical protein